MTVWAHDWALGRVEKGESRGRLQYYHGVAERYNNNKTMPGDRDDPQNLIGNKLVLSADLRRVERYVKDDLFSRVIFVFGDGQMKEGSFLHRDFVSNCSKLISRSGRAAGMGHETEGETSNNDVCEAYMTYIWTVLGRDKLYKKWMSTKRSNTYQAVQDKFQGESDEEGVKSVTLYYITNLTHGRPHSNSSPLQAMRGESTSTTERRTLSGPSQKSKDVQHILQLLLEGGDWRCQLEA